MTTITVRAKIAPRQSAVLYDAPSYAMEINTTTNSARLLYKGKWYPVKSFMLTAPCLPGNKNIYSAVLKKPLPGNVYAAEYAYIMGAPWVENDCDADRKVRVQTRNGTQRKSASAVFRDKKTKRVTRVYGQIFYRAGKFGENIFVPRDKRAA